MVRNAPSITPQRQNNADPSTKFAGSPEGPWNHSARLEAVLGSRLCVLSVVDPDSERSKSQIESKKSGDYPEAWSSTFAAKSLEEARERIPHSTILHLIILGCPPHFRGTTKKGRDMDIQVINTFPNAKGLLIEKPVAALDLQVADCDQVAKRLQEWTHQGGVVSVGYMLRYCLAMEKIK